MASYSLLGLPEVFATSAAHRGAVAEGLRSGAIRKIRRGLYTTNPSDPLEAVVKRNLWPIVALLCPGAVVSHRTALDGRPSPSGLVVVTAGYDRIIELPGLRVRQLKGPGPLEGDAAFIGGLFMSSRARIFLECLSGRVSGPESPYLKVGEVESHLERLLLLGQDKLNETRDLARRICEPLDARNEFDRMDASIGALLGTRSSRLSSRTAIARAAGEPYEPARLELFQALLDELASWPETPRPDPVASGTAFQNIGFFDAYFSNFIEGTEFEVDEALAIAFDNKIPTSRPDDAHDVLGTFRIVASPTETATRISELPSSDFGELLRSWHATILQGRPDKRPGEFKEVANQAGLTLFVEPQLVRGTLRRGFEMAKAIRTPFGRAAFLMFLISEVHPFDDGNGRLARAVANAELVSNKERRILVPTVFRTEYVDSLRVLSGEKRPRTFVRMADAVQEFSADVDFTDLPTARARLEAWHAFDTDSESRLRRPR